MCQALIDEAVTRLALNNAEAVMVNEDGDKCLPELVTDYSSNEGEANKSDNEYNIGQGGSTHGLSVLRGTRKHVQDEKLPHKKAPNLLNGGQ